MASPESLNARIGIKDENAPKNLWGNRVAYLKFYHQIAPIQFGL